VATLWRILATLSLVAINAFFVAAEFSAVAARASRFENHPGSSSLQRLLFRACRDIKRRLAFYLSSCQFGVTLASLGLGAVTQPAVAALVAPFLPTARSGHTVAFVIALAVATSLHIIVGEQTPKNWAIRFADRGLPLLALPLVLFTYLFYPAISFLNFLTVRLLKWTGLRALRPGEAQSPHSEAELKAVVAQAISAGTIDTGEGRILASALEFGQLKVRQIMTPRTAVDYLTLEQPISELLHVVQRSAYTRLPLCDGDLDHVIGLVHMKDLFNHLNLVAGKLKFVDEKAPDGLAVAVPAGMPGSEIHVIGAGHIDLRKIKREILFVPELSNAPRLLRLFQSSQIHLAVVVDEYGATQGIVTLEDVLEELVGEIADEHDVASPSDFVREGPSVRVGGLYPLRDLVDRLNLRDVDESEVDTVGGYVVQKLNHWPKPGDTVQLGSHVVRVLSVNQNRVGQVMITPEDTAHV
jgi:CBS domain containing-hemolysin-like protein